MSAATLPPDELLTEEETAAALETARELIRAGVPIFLAKPDPTAESGYTPPPKWDTAIPLLDVINRWRPGWALCAVGGHVCDFLDVDPRNGGDVEEAGLRNAGIWPTSYGRATTPSGGTHDIITPLRIGKGKVTPGIDLQGGLPVPDDEGKTHRGFVFIAPTVRVSKVDGARRAYRWVIEPAMDVLTEEADTDDSGDEIATIVAEYGKKPRSEPGRNTRQKTEAPPDPVGLLHTHVTAFEKLTTEGNNRTQQLDNLAMLAGHGVPTYWTADAARTRLLEAALANGFIRAHGQRAALTQINSGLTDGAQEPWATPDPSERAYHNEVAHELRRLKIRDDARRLHRAEQAGPIILPVPVLLTDLLAEPDSPTRYRIDGLLPAGGRVVLSAQFKSGKSTLMGNLIRCLADGDPFLDSHLVTQTERRIVLVDNEMPRDTIKYWLRDQGIQNPGQIAVIPTRGNVTSFDVLNPDVRKRWIDLIRQYDPEVLILDCLRPVIDALGLDENNDAGQVLMALDEIAEQSGSMELIVVHHMGHLSERARGSSRIRDWPDAEWRLVRKEPDDPSSQRFFTAYGRDVDVSETALEYDPANRHLSVAGGSRLDIVATSLLPDLVDLLADQPGLSGRGIEDKLMDVGVSRATARAAVNAGIDQGYVITVPGPNRSTLHHAHKTKRPERRTGAPVRRKINGAPNEGHPNFGAPKDQITEHTGQKVSAPVRRSAPINGGAPVRSQRAGSSGDPPKGGPQTGALNSQVNAPQEDQMKRSFGAPDEDPLNPLDASDDRWVHTHLTTRPQTIARLATDLDATTTTLETALTRLESIGHAQRHPRPGQPDGWSLPTREENQ